MATFIIFSSSHHTNITMRYKLRLFFNRRIAIKCKKDRKDIANEFNEKKKIHVHELK